ncbi:LptA/OstA family protein [Commensalibacter oyaizuii]|uniref:LptA/OstA family protein n=1 Tax=Commensalibacter oyaizuii TaxID=3043873 RepID=A0ABT6PZ29_9PROT|nr:LptA/OstA family protein [Commensalibacter sp. TBRC 16381]MDI2090102.1 LptA/OstA family protein [Commensalibacter sp. TBRC 16381]
MNYKHALLLALLCFTSEGLYASGALAQNIDLSHGGQITVTALGGFNWDQNAKSVTAYDHAKAVRGDVTVTADRLVAMYRKKANAADNQPKPEEKKDDQKSGDITQDSSGSNEIYRLYAYGHVHIYTNTDQAWGDKAIYDIDQATLVLTGKNMKLTTPQNIMTARDAMEYHSQTRMSVGRGDATVTSIKDGRRIKADVLVGYSAPTDQKSQPANANNNKNSDDVTRSSKLEKVNAFGNVVVRTQNETVRGDRGVYVPNTGIARVVGNVHITRGSNQLNGHAAIINMRTGIAHMTEAPGRRVQGLVVPNESNQPNK